MPDPARTDTFVTPGDSLADVVLQISEKSRAGQAVDLEECCRQHPAHAEQLRRLWPTLEALADYGPPDSDPRVAAVLPASLDRETPDGTLGDFRLLREIGRGGMGVVYEAEQISLRRRVALKVLPFAAVLDKRQLQRFNTEAMAAARLHHQHIVPVYQVGCERAVHFYAMQYIDGRNVAELIRETRRRAGLEPAPDLASAFAPTDTPRGRDPGGRGSRRAGGAQDVEQPEPPSERQRHHREGEAPAEPPRGARRDEPPARPLSPAPDTAKLADISTDYSAKRINYHRRIAELGIQAAQALDFAHQHGVLHRDIKPSNLMLDSDGELWITDFGLARIEGDEGLTMSGDLLGTLRYMSPEQVLGKRVVIDQRTDVYSLGVSLYEMLTLRPAYDGADRAELLRQISFESPTPLRKLDPSIPTDLETIVLTAMAREPHRRYETAQELADDLQRYLDGKPIVAKLPSRRERMLKWVGRNKQLTAMVALLLVAVAVAAAAIRDSLSHRAAVPSKEAVSALTSRAPVEQPPLPSINPARSPGRTLPGLVPEPALIPNAGRWQLITKQPRGVIRSAVWSPDEQQLALAEANHVRIYDARDMQIAHVLVGHAQPVRSVAWHPDGERLASCSEDGTVRLWTSAGKPTHLLEGHTGPVYQVAWRPDGSQLASCGADGTIRLWSPDGKQSQMLDEGDRHVFGIDWSPDGQLLATVGGDIRPAGPDGSPGDNSLKLWNPDSGKLHSKIPSSVKYSGLCVDWRPDGQQLAVGYGHIYRQMHWEGKPLPDAGVRLWNINGTSGPEVGRDKGSINTLAWSADGEQLAFAGRGSNVHIWHSLDGHIADVDVLGEIEYFSLSWSRHSTRLLVGQRDAVLEWDGDATTVPLARAIGRQVGFDNAVWSPDGRMLYGASSGPDGNVWTPFGAPLSAPEPPASDVQPWWHRDNPARRPDGTPAPALEGNPTRAYQIKFAWSKDGWLAAASWNDQSVRIWNDQGQLVATCLGHRGGVESVAWSPDAMQVVSGGGDSARIWNRDGSAGPVMTGHADEVYGVAWSPDGQWIASGGTDSTVRLWKAKDGEPGPVLRGHQGGVFAVGWSPDSKKLASASWLDNTLRVWDVATGKTEWQALRLNETTTVTLSPSGAVFDGDRDVLESSLLYGIEGRDGTLELLDVNRFRQRFGTHLVMQLRQPMAAALEAHHFTRADGILTEALALRSGLDPQGRREIAAMADQLASALYFERDCVQAEQATRTAIEIHEQIAAELPDDTKIQRPLSGLWLHLGRVLGAAGRNTESLAAITTAIEITQAKNQSSSAAGWLFFERAQRQRTLELALADLDRVVELDPGIDRIAWDLIYFLDRLVDEPRGAGGDPAREIPAEQQFNIAKSVHLEAVKRLPKLPYQYVFAVWLCSAPERFRDPDLALQVAQQQLELTPADSDIQEYLAWAQFRSGDPQACLATLGKITYAEAQSSEEAATTEFFRAMAFHSLGNTTEARAAFDRGAKRSKEFFQTAYVGLWKDGKIWCPTPAMVRRLQTEAAAMLGITEDQPGTTAPPPETSPKP